MNEMCLVNLAETKFIPNLLILLHNSVLIFHILKCFTRVCQWRIQGGYGRGHSFSNSRNHNHGYVYWDYTPSISPLPNRVGKSSPSLRGTLAITTEEETGSARGECIKRILPVVGMHSMAMRKKSTFLIMSPLET